MNALLIHNDNIPYSLTRNFQASIRFHIPLSIANDDNFSFDNFVHEFITKHLSEKAYDAIFLSCSLSDNNYLDLSGLSLALHIRLTPQLKHNLVPIVFLSLETKEQIAKLMEDPSFLFTTGIFFLNKFDFESCLLFFQWIKMEWKTQYEESLLSDSEYADFLSRLNIKNPGHLDTSHSITNEWALGRYFEMLDPPHSISNNRNNEITINNYSSLEDHVKELRYNRSLHSKLLSLRWGRQYFTKAKHRKSVTVSNRGDKKVGLIDDDYNKGWLYFYKYLLSDSGDEVMAYENFEKDFTREDLIKKIVEWVKFKNNVDKIDLFIVDLRLHPEDYYEKDISKLSGVQIIKIIKNEINPGIQILVVTASNKYFTFKELLKYKVNGYIIKESPDKESTREITISSVDNLVRSLNDSFNDLYLAELYREIDKIKENIQAKIKNNKLSDDRIIFYETLSTRGGFLDEIFNILNSGNTILLNSALLTCLSILENYSELYCVFESTWKVFDDNGSIVFNYIPNSHVSGFELVYGHFNDIMIDCTDESKKTITSMLFYSADQQRKPDTGRFKIYPQYYSPMLKIALTLKYKNKLNDYIINELFKIRYIRNNSAAHIGKNIKQNVKIGSQDILFIINKIFSKILDI